MSSLREDDGNDHAVETESLTEDENKDHSDEDCLLLGVCAHTSVTDDTNSESSSLQVLNMRVEFLRVGRIILTREERPQVSPEAKCL